MVSEQTTTIAANADCVTLINVFTVKPQDQDRLVKTHLLLDTRFDLPGDVGV